MNEMLASFLAAKRAEQLETKKKERNELLVKLGLVNVTREYAPEDIRTLFDANAAGYNKTESADGQRRFYKEIATPIEISDEEYADLVSVLKEEPQKPAVPAKRAETTGKQPEKAAERKHFWLVAGDAGRSPAALFFRIIAFIVWIGGFIMAIVATNNAYSSARFVTFITTLLAAGLWGCMVYFAAELYQNVQNIADRVASAKITEEP